MAWLVLPAPVHPTACMSEVSVNHSLVDRLGGVEPAAWPVIARAGLWLMVPVGWALLAWNLGKSITLHVDEIAVLNNILDAQLGDFARPLKQSQVAPFGFLAAVRGAVGTLGLSHSSVRLVAWVAAVLSVPLFAGLVRRSASPLPGLVVMAGFIASGEWLLQACRVKPYTLDVLFTLLTLHAAMWLMRRRCELREALVLSAVAAVGFWFSIAFYLVFAGVGLVLLVSCLSRERRGELCWLSVPAGVGVLSGGLHYVLVLRPQMSAEQTAGYMAWFWDDAFLPMPWADPSGLAYGLAKGVGDASGLALPGLVLALLVLGAVVMIVRRDPRVWIFLAPVLLAIGASMAHAYPMGDRLVLFLGPVVLLLVAAGLDGLARAIPGRAGLVLVLIGSAVLLTGPAKHRGTAPFSDHALPVLQHVRDNRRPHQSVYLYYGASTAYDFYTEHMDAGLAIPADRLIRGGGHRDDWPAYADEVAGLRNRGEVWVVFSHNHRSQGIDEEEYFLQLLDREGERLAEYRAWGAATILWRSDANDARSANEDEQRPTDRPEPSP